MARHHDHLRRAACADGGLSVSIVRKFWQFTRLARALRFWIVLLLAVVGWLAAGDAFAQSCPAAAVPSPAGGSFQYEGQAKAACEAAGAATDGLSQGGFIRHFHSCRAGSGNSFGVWYTIGRRNSDCQQTAQFGTETRLGNFYDYSVEGCPPGEIEQPDGTCSAECATRAPIHSKAVRGSTMFCNDGCSFEQYHPGGVTVCLGGGASMYCAAGEWRATGQTCTVSDNSEPWNPDNDTCRSIPGSGFSECVKPNGEHCVTGAKGTRMCWQPGESGERMPETGVEGANKGSEGSDPPPPNGMEEPTKTGSTTTTINNSTTTTNTFTGSGNSGGQHNTGSGGSKPGGQGEGEGDGEEGSASGGASCTAPPICSGDAIACAALEQSWRMRCEGTKPGDEAEVDAMRDGMAGAISGLDDGPPEGSGIWNDNDDPFAGARESRDENWMLSKISDERFMTGQCPVVEAVQIGPVSIPIDLAPLCSLLSNLSGLVLALAYLIAFRIMAGGAS